MELFSLKRRRRRRSEIPKDNKLGYLGLQLDAGSKPSNKGKNNVGHESSWGRTCKIARQVEEPNAKVQPRALTTHTVVSSILNVVVQDGSGSTELVTNIGAIPTAPTVLALPVGTFTIPSLRVLDGTLMPGNSLPTAASRTDSRSSPTSGVTATPAATSSLNSSSALNSSTSTSSSSVSSSPSTSSSSSSPSSSPISSITSRNSSSSTPTTMRTSFSTSMSSSSGFGGLIASGTGTATGSPATPTSTESSAAAAGSSSTSPNTPKIVGGVVGGVAGIALVLAVLLVLLRWQRRRSGGASELRSNAGTPQPDTSREPPMAEMPTQPMGAAGAVAATSNPFADPPNAAAAATAPASRSFQKLGGRKLESVLKTGGDGYDEPKNPQPMAVAESAAGASFFRDSEGNYGGPASNTSSVNAGTAANVTRGPAPPVPDRRNPGIFRSPPSDGESSPSPTPDIASSPPDVVLMRPGPARQPVTSPGFSTPPHLRRDPIGRSHPSFDGSRGSRGSKFAEDLT